MKRTEVALYINGKPVRGIIDQFEATDQAFVTSGDADGVTNTLNFTNSTGGTFTVTNSALLFNDAYVTSGSLNAGTGIITFTNSSGGTFEVSGFQVGASYWSSTAHDNIIASGDSATHTMVPGTLGITGNTWVQGSLGVGMGTDTPTGLFEVKDLIKFPETNSVFVGDDAGSNWEAGSTSNTGMGRLSMGLGTMSSAVQNTAFGFASLGYITSGDYNTAVGLQANTSIDTGSWNTAIGKTAMFGATYHSYNTAVGANTMYFTTSGALGKTVATDTHNTAVGYSSQYYNLNGAYNTSVGSQSIGNSSIAYAGTGSTAIGYKSLFNNTTGNYNTTFGYQAGDNITTGDYNISIGPDADPPSATADYQMNIGGIIHGQDAYGDSAISQIGIGTTGPKVKLDVHHNPTNLGNDTGGGEVVTFGTASGALTIGKLYYLNTSGVWTGTQANASSSHGNSQLLGIALGTAVSDGILIRGFFDMNSYLTGTFHQGLPLYVCETTAGNINVAAPAATNEFIRVVGYATTTANVIYFNPDGTYITLS